MHRPLPLLTLTMLCGVTAAQAPAPEPREVQVERSFQGNFSYSESISRELFSACDANRDDRLDVFESADALQRLRAPSDTEGYSRLDTDRDGFLGWPEFDALFRRSVANGGTFRVRVCRAFVEPPKPPQPPSPLERFLKVHDADSDGALSPEEVDKLIETMGLPAPLVGPLRALDLDGSGKIEEAELAPWFQLMPMGMPGAPGMSSLPQPWYEADGDASGAIELDELRDVLRRIDVSLLRWAEALLKKLDRNQDGKLDLNELPTPPGAASTPKPTPGEVVPQRAPQR